MALNEEQQNAVMEVFRIQQREDRAAIDRTNSRMRPRTKEAPSRFVWNVLIMSSPERAKDCEADASAWRTADS